MTCFMCKSKLSQGYSSFSTEIDKCVVVVKNVPSLICEQCGDISYSDKVARRLEQIVNSIRETLVTEIAVVCYTEKAA